MTQRTQFTAAEIIRARNWIIGLSTDELLSKGYVNIPAVLGINQPYDVVLEETNLNRKIQTIKEIRTVTSLGLYDAKTLTETTPSFVLRGVSWKKAQAAATQIRLSGSVVSVRKVSDR